MFVWFAALSSWTAIRAKSRCSLPRLPAGPVIGAMMPTLALQLAVLAPPVEVLLLPPDAAGGLDELLLHAAARASRPHAAVALTAVVFTVLVFAVLTVLVFTATVLVFTAEASFS